MFTIRRAAERGYFDHGWLKTFHTFSFSGYFDPRHKSYRAIRVINEDVIAPGEGFGTHPHQEMEIVTYVLSGALAHRDSMGHETVLRPGEFQRMSAGTGLTHSEFNPSATDPVHLYQIWLYPERRGVEPSYEQREFPESERQNRWQLVADPQGADGALHIEQAARIYLANLTAEASLSFTSEPGRGAWLQVLRGTASLAGNLLSAGDAVAIEGQAHWSLDSTQGAEVMLFDLA